MISINIIRVEHIYDGFGMFVSRYKDLHRPFIEKVPNSIYERHRSFNNPQDDGLKMGDKWFCGYKNIEQFKGWVLSDELDILLSIGFRVYNLEVTNFQIGECQVIYTKESIISKKDISETIKL